MLLQIITAAPVPTTLTLVNDTVATGYILLEGAQWGNAVWEHQFSGPRGTQGARPAQGVPQNRPVVLPIRVSGTSKDDLALSLSTLSAAVDELRRFGGRLKWKSNSETYAQYFQVMAGTSGVTEWGNRAENVYRAVVTVEAVCAPYVVGDPMDVFDDFSTDTITAGDYTFDVGSSATTSVSGGAIVVSTTGERRLIHTGRGYSYADAQVTLKYTTGASVAGTGVGVVIKRLDASNYVYARISGGSNNQLSILKIDGGASTGLGAASGTFPVAPAAATTYWMRGRIEGNVVTVEHWTTEPTSAGTPATTLTYLLTTVPADATKFGAGVAGQAGMRPTPLDTAWTYDDFRVEPFTYASRTLPSSFRFGSSVPGDAPALADVAVTPSGGAAAPVFALIGWSQRPLVHNYVWNGDFEDSGIGTNGWTVVADDFLAGTSTKSQVTADAQALGYGQAAMQVVTPATTNAGASFRIYRRFRKGTTYTFTARLWAPSSVTTAQLAMGISGDSATTSAVALTTTAAVHLGTWTPLADQDTALISARIRAATATTFRIDAVDVFEGTTAPTTGRHAEGAGSVPPIGVLNAAAGDSSDLGAGWAVTASGSGRSGYILTSASATAATASWWIDPNTLVPDDYTYGELAVEVWARIQVDSAASTPKYVLSVRPADGTSYGTERFTFEYGTSGKRVSQPSSSTAWRMVRLGTLPLVVDTVQPRRWKVWLAYSAIGANTSSVDYLVMVPSRQRALSPTGKVNDSTYPKFVASTNETVRTIRSDLSGRTAKPPFNPQPDTGLGGSMIELPFGNVEGLVKLSSLVPDDPTSDTTTEQLSHTATVHYAVTPRWALLRGNS